MKKVEFNKGPFAQNTHQHCTNTGRTHIYCRGRIHCQPWYKRWRWYLGDIFEGVSALVLG